MQFVVGTSGHFKLNCFDNNIKNLCYGEYWFNYWSGY